MPSYPFSEKLRLAIDSLEECSFKTWLLLLAKSVKVPPRLIELGFSEDDVRTQMTALQNESVENLIKLAVEDEATNHARTSPAVVVLSQDKRRETFEIVKRLTQSESACERAVGFSVLMRDVGTAFHPEAIQLVADGFDGETEPNVLEMLAYALAHLRMEQRSKFLSPHVKNSSAGVRQAVAYSLGGEVDKQSIESLMTLTCDSCDEVRDWATFSLGTLCERNTKRIREALFARLTDEHFETRNEAMFGLAARRDERVLPYVREALQGEQISSVILESAEKLADPSLCPLLETLKKKWEERHAGHWLVNCLDNALRGCRRKRKRSSVKTR